MPQHSASYSSRACATRSFSRAAAMTIADERTGGRAPLPPDGRLEVLDLVDRQSVDATREVLPAVVGDDEHDVPLLQLTGDPHGDARDRAAGDAREDALLIEQPARPDDRVAVGYEDLAIEQREVDDRGGEGGGHRAQTLHRLALHRLSRDDLHGVAECLLQPPAVAHQRAAGAQPRDERGDLVELF